MQLGMSSTLVKPFHMQLSGVRSRVQHKSAHVPSRQSHMPSTHSIAFEKFSSRRRTRCRAPNFRVRAARGETNGAATEVNKAEGKKRAVVVGGGWAGFGACYQLLKDGFEVTLVDAAENPGGLSTGWRTPKGRAVEAGIKGFWYHYFNIFKLVEELGIEDPFTDWTQSAFWNPSGIQVEAPVLQRLPRLPAPLGTLVYTDRYFTRLPYADRLSALPLIPALLSYDADSATYAEFDQKTARQVLRDTPGVSPALYDTFLEPMLLALMFAKGADLSAAAAFDVLYTYVLAHQPDFDVKWCKGSVSERIFQPWVAEIKRRGGAVLGSRKVASIQLASVDLAAASEINGSKGARESRSNGDGVKQVTVRHFSDGQWSEEVLEAEAVVLAVGINAMKLITASSPDLAARADFAAVANLRGVDVMAVRLWFDRKVIGMSNVSNVGAGFDTSTGFTFYDLNKLQEEYADEAGSVVEVDFYNAGALLPLTDLQVVERVQMHYLGGCVRGFRAAAVTDFSVLRFRAAVTAFSPGSHAHMPQTQSSIKGVYFAGDWVRQGPGAEYGQRGLSQEKALVTGILAANKAAIDMGLVRSDRKAPILQPEADEPHVAAAKEATKSLIRVTKALPKLW